MPEQVLWLAKCAALLAVALALASLLGRVQ